MSKPELLPTAIAKPLSVDSASTPDGLLLSDRLLVSAHSWSERPPADGEFDPLIGTTLNDDYLVERLLGEGGMGRVYQARHTRIAQKRYAIKVLRGEFTGNPEVLARFQREAEAAACISHPNVVGVYDVDRTPQGLPYLASEYLKGIELADHLRKVGKLHQLTAVHICHQICDALEAAHAQGVIHRDIKPQNVFLVGDFRQGVPLRPFVKVLDFGLSRFQDATGNTLTRTGIIMGTPSFMAPEQARGERTDHRTDIYGVGAILYTLLTGRLPFSEDTPQMTILAVMDRDPPRPRSIDPNISQHLELIIQRAMAKEPGDRYPDITALKFALDPFTTALRPAEPMGAVSHLSLESVAAEVGTARPRLVLLLVLTVFLLAVSLAMALAAVGVLTGWLTFNATELALLLVAAIGTSLTPAVILIRRMRREIWNNTAKVLVVLENLRPPLLAGLLGYGCVTLFVRFGDVVLSRFTAVRLFGHPHGMAWAGWDLLFPVVAFLAAGVAVLRRALLGNEPSRWRKFLAGPMLHGAALLLASAVIYGGLHWRAATTEAPTPTVVREPVRPTSSGLARHRPAPAHSVAPSLSAAPPNRSPATARDDELADAIAGGEQRLLPLWEKYPNDPDVLRPLVFAFASRATGHADAMVVARRLFAIAPEQTRDGSMQVLVTKTAQTKGKAADLAFELLAAHMGTTGPDLLYDLMLTKPAVAARAGQLLERRDVRSRMSPALKIAYELRATDSCAGRVPLLDRAASLGDERTIAILGPPSLGSKKGCGKWKQQPCPPGCAKEAPAYRQAVAAISTRLRGLR